MREKTFAKLDSMFIERWSPRAFTSEPIAQDDLLTMFEAANWSPSCYNEQPWRFVIANEEETHAKFVSILGEGNQVWAKNASLLMVVLSRRHFTHNGSENRWADFDTGAAAMAFTLQANKLGYHTHYMGGFDEEKAYTVTGADKQEYNAVCVIAVGKMGDKSDLPENLQERETPSARHSIEEIVFEP